MVLLISRIRELAIAILCETTNLRKCFAVYLYGNEVMMPEKLAIEKERIINILRNFLLNTKNWKKVGRNQVKTPTR